MGIGGSEHLGLFSAAAVLILLLGCANVGNLVLARAAARRLDTNVRLALGATRPRLVRQLLSESFTLSIVAALVSILLARTVLPSFLERQDPCGGRWPLPSMCRRSCSCSRSR